MSDIEVNYYDERFDDEEIETGEKFMRSPLSDWWYHVTAWVDQGGGRAIAVQKERVDESEVPQDVLNRPADSRPSRARSSTKDQ